MRQRNRKGFTLTEIAVVLGVIGIILGAIWGAAATAYDKIKTAEALRGVIFAANQMRNMYANNPKLPLSPDGSGEITVWGTFPPNWTSPSCINRNSGISVCYTNPWYRNSTMELAQVMNGKEVQGLSSSTFIVRLTDVGGAGCAGLLEYFNSNASSINGGPIQGLVGNSVSTEGSTDPNNLNTSILIDMGSSPGTWATQAEVAAGCKSGTQVFAG